MIRIKIATRAAVPAAWRSDACAAIWRVASSERFDADASIAPHRAAPCPRAEAAKPLRRVIA
ncbi:hypothetical protein WL93_11800 [Burkholderia diffusa]|nr:hypothetical protein WL93_11800 [Burkholderia diffusa]